MTGHVSFLRIPLIIFKIVITVSLIIHCKKGTIISVVLDPLNSILSYILYIGIIITVYVIIICNYTLNNKLYIAVGI